MSRPSQAQMRDARDVLAAIIEEMPDPQTWRASESAAYLRGAVTALGLATGSDRSPATTTKGRKA